VFSDRCPSPLADEGQRSRDYDDIDADDPTGKNENDNEKRELTFKDDGQGT